MVGFISVLLEVVKEPANGFLVIVAFLAFNDNLREVNLVGNNEPVN